MYFIRMIRRNPDLAMAALLAAATMSVVPFAPQSMLQSINFSLLLLLFCLMSIVAGLRQSGLLTYAYRQVFQAETSSRKLGRFFIFSCFFSSMLITNDVALIIFVPMSILVFTEGHAVRLMIPVVVWQTIAANMGSMLTPIGNPQNLYLYAYYGMDIGTFLQLTAPPVLLSGTLIYLATCFLPDRIVQLSTGVAADVLPMRRILWLLGLFLLCLLYVLRVIPATWLAALVLPAVAVIDCRLFRAVDYKLLLLFVLLFVTVGNLSRMPFMQSWPAALLSGHEFVVSLLLSQFLSNVPTTVMLAQYTQNAGALLLGVNIGGLGTIIASMASIISFKAYLSTRHSRMQYYLSFFTLANLGLLLTLLACQGLFMLCRAYYYGT